MNILGLDINTLYVAWCLVKDNLPDDMGSWYYYGDRGDAQGVIVNFAANFDRILDRLLERYKTIDVIGYKRPQCKTKYYIELAEAYVNRITAICVAKLADFKIRPVEAPEVKKYATGDGKAPVHRMHAELRERLRKSNITHLPHPNNFEVVAAWVGMYLGEGLEGIRSN